MKTTTLFITILLAAALLSGCGAFPDLMRTAEDGNAVNPSDTIITETRDASGFNAIEMSAFGKVILSQGESETLVVTGSDNVVPLIITEVSNGRLTIRTEPNVNIRRLDEDTLTIEITVVDLSRLEVSGLGDIEMDALATSGLDLILSGGGNMNLYQLQAESVDIVVSGLGNMEVAGKVNECKIEISGGGSVKAGELECQVVDANISGLGNITVWATEQLTGSITGGGSVSYYGNPQTDTEATGLGDFKPLGGK